MDTTIKVSAETKARLKNLSVAQKGKTFNALINELVSSFERHEGEHSEAFEGWKRQNTEWQRRDAAWQRSWDDWQKTKDSREAEYAALLEWARSQGFERNK